MRKLLIFASLLIAASMVLTACGPTTAATQAPAAGAPAAGPKTFTSKDPTTFFAPTFGEPETLDPALDYETAGGEIVSNVYETLVWYNKDKASTDFIPQLAEKWDVSADGKTYTFTIRKGVTFHNGDTLTPTDVAYTFQRGLLQNGSASPQWLLSEPFFGVGKQDIADVVGDATAKWIADMVVAGNEAKITFPVLGVDKATLDKTLTGVDMKDAAAVAKAISDAGIISAPYDDQKTLAALDPAILKAVCTQTQSSIVADDNAGTVTMTLAQSWGPFLATIANNWGSIMDKKWVVDNKGWDGTCDTWQNYYAMTSQDDPFTAIANGTGPFKLDHWTKGTEIVLARNDNYWRTTPAYDGGPSGPAKLSRVVIQTVNEFGTRFAQFQAGDADRLVVGSQADYAQVDPQVGEECDYNNTTSTFDACKPVGDGSGPFRMYKGFPQVIHTDVFFNYKIASNQYIGSGKLDGNGIPPDFFQDVNIRKAFNYCFDWATFIKDVMVGEGVQTLTIPVAGMPGYDANAPHYTFDATKCADAFKASTLKSADGKSVWDTGFRFQATYNIGNTARQSVAEILAANLAAVNAKFLVETLGLPWPSFLQSQRAKTLPVFISGWLEDIHDPSNWYTPYLTGTYGSRQSLPADLRKQYQDLLAQGVTENDPAKRDAIYKQVNQIQYDNPSLILLATATGRRYEQRWVQGWYYNPVFSGEYFYSLSKQ
jgi:peptide/nickel transport system substrate-binding protein